MHESRFKASATPISPGRKVFPASIFSVPVSSGRYLRWRLGAGFLGAVMAITTLIAASPPRQTPAIEIAPGIEPTEHTALSNDLAMLWLAPVTASETAQKAQSTAAGRFARGVRAYSDGKYAEALPLFDGKGLEKTPLADYAAYYAGLTQYRLSRLDQAAATLDALRERPLVGYLTEAAALRRAEVAEAQKDFERAAEIYEGLVQQQVAAPDEVLVRLGNAAHSKGDRDRAVTAYQIVYYQHPLSAFAAVAGSELERLEKRQPLAGDSPRFQLEMARAQRLYDARRYAQAKSAFQELRGAASGDDRDLMTLRMAQADFHLRRYAAARTALQPLTTRGSRRAEAQYFYLTAVRRANNHAEYVRLARKLTAEFPESVWAEETLNDLATHYILVGEDDRAIAVFREQYEKFPKGKHAERAAWRAGWASYKAGDYREAIRLFEEAAANFPRSDSRPPYLYWSARARDHIGDRESANRIFSIVGADYLNSYYGRLASVFIEERKINVARRVEATLPVNTALPPGADIVRTLVSLELYDQAMDELLHAQRTTGAQGAIDATIALIHYRRGDLRRGINAMKRAYPQYLAAGGEDLPADIMRILFPMAYWDLIVKQCAQKGLDPYLVAALIAQESTFDARIRSSANAIGLMQIIPSTGRRYARLMKIGNFSNASLTRPEINVNIGTRYFSDLMKRFGGAHYALASYNAGENRIVRWIAERPGMPADEWVDDIPFPETRNYVKKVLGTAEDYRKLYGPGGLVAPSGPPGSKATVPASTVKPAAAKPPAKAPVKKAPA
jgi:soluble lytic murein transglycosylase